MEMSVNDKGSANQQVARADNLFFKPLYTNIMYDTTQQYPSQHSINQQPQGQQQHGVQPIQQFQQQYQQTIYPHQQQSAGSGPIQHLPHSERQALNKEYEQPRYYNSQMVIQQPQYMQVPTGSQYSVNQSIMYSGQQPVYESIPVNNYLLVSNSTGHNQVPTQSNSISSASVNRDYQIMNKPHNSGASYIMSFIERLQNVLPSPPLATAETRQDLNLNLHQKRAKRKSKFTKKQDEAIVMLKKKGKSWVEIAEIAGVGSYLAARNRYQVIMGQQGNYNSSSWVTEDKELLKRLLDGAECDKWKFIAAELSKATNKSFTEKECREMVRSVFWENPTSFGVNEETISECIKEKKITEKINQQSRRSYPESLYNNPVLNSTSTMQKQNIAPIGFFPDNQASDFRSSSEPIGNNDLKPYY